MGESGSNSSVFGTNMQLQAFVFTLQKSTFLWGSGTSVLSDVEVKDSSKTRPGFTDLLLKFLCHSVAQLSTVCVTTQQ